MAVPRKPVIQVLRGRGGEETDKVGVLGKCKLSGSTHTQIYRFRHTPAAAHAEAGGETRELEKAQGEGNGLTKP